MMLHRLDGARTTLLLLQRAGQDMPEIVHWGARLADGIAAEDAATLRDRAIPPNALDHDIPAATLFPTLGAGLFLAPALAAHRAGRDWTADFVVANIRTEDHGLSVRAFDQPASLALELRLSLRPDGDVLTIQAILTNRGPGALDVAQFSAGAIALPPDAVELLTFGARWGHEFAERRTLLPSGLLAVENRRGRTSHDHFPLLIAGKSAFDEGSGVVWGVHVGASGNHRITAERLPDGGLLVTAGELLHPGEAILGPGESLHTPCAYAAWSDAGLAGLSRAFHACIRAHVLPWRGGATPPRPVTMNTWEGTYFDHDERRLMAQAEAAAQLGIERFVLDDGWMRGRSGDTAGLGDWTADPQTYPNGLAPLASRIVSLGMQFGLWVEPEMANPDSDFLRAHPDAVLRVHGRPVLTARHQLVLDLTRPEVFAAIHSALAALLDALPIAYLKWDMNRELVAAGDARGQAVYRRQVQAVHALIDGLRSLHPALEIETCASGGGRADLGMLARTHRIWTSDCTDALDRLAIQRGASRLLPSEVLGAHVSASPNHQTGRRHTLAFRAAAAMLFHFGVELDPLALAEDDRIELAAWISLHKRLRPLLHAGEHVGVAMQDGRSLRGVVARDRGSAVYLAAQESSPLHAVPPPLRLPGLAAATRYRLTAPAPQLPPQRVSSAHRRLFGDGIVLAGDLLGSVGFVPPPLQPETALVLHAVREEG